MEEPAIAKRPFFWRSFISFGLAWSFAIMFVSGFILYIAPHGRVANSLDWHLLLLNRGQWQVFHTIFSYVFATFGFLHLFSFNWRAFWSYLKTKRLDGLHRKREFWLSMALTVGIFAGTYLNWQPFLGVMQIGDWAKGQWQAEAEPRPRVSLPAAAAPESAQAPEPQGQGAGLGRMTLAEVATLLGTTPEALVASLRDRGIVAGPTSSLRSVAQAAGTTPAELLESLEAVALP